MPKKDGQSTLVAKELNHLHDHTKGETKAQKT